MQKFVVALAAILTSWTPPLRADETAIVPAGDPAMAAAYRKAAATLDQFLAAWRQPPTGAKRFAVKVGLKAVSTPPGFEIVRPGSPGVVEYFWIGDLSQTAQGFAGAVHNEPENVHAVRSGSRISFGRADIADWTYFENGKIAGNATACPALAHASPDEQRQMREQYGLVCD